MTRIFEGVEGELTERLFWRDEILQAMYWMQGDLNIEYAFFIGIIILVSSIMGLTLVNQAVKRTGRQSVIVFTLGVVILIAFLLLPFKYAFK